MTIQSLSTLSVSSLDDSVLENVVAGARSSRSSQRGWPALPNLDIDFDINVLFIENYTDNSVTARGDGSVASGRDSIFR
jgi:hypothetical protein